MTQFNTKEKAPYQKIKDMKTKRLYVLTLLITAVSFVGKLHAQIAINKNGLPADLSAILDITSNDRGLLMPRMTTLEREGIADPAQGLVLYDTDLENYYFFRDTAWSELVAAKSTSARSLLISANTLASSSLSGNTDIGIVNPAFFIPSIKVIDMGSGGIGNIVVNLPKPADLVNGFLSAKILYTSNSSIGNFNVSILVEDYAPGDDLTSAPLEVANATIPAPIIFRHLAVEEIPLDSSALYDEDAEQMLLIFRRNTGSSSDTSTKTLKILGILLEYQGS